MAGIPNPPLKQAATAPASGTVTLTFRTRGSYIFKATQFTSEMQAGTATAVSGSATGALYLDGWLVSPFVPQADAVSGEPSVPFGPGQEVTAVYTGCTPGNIVKGQLMYDIVGTA